MQKGWNHFCQAMLIEVQTTLDIVVARAHAEPQHKYIKKTITVKKKAPMKKPRMNFPNSHFSLNQQKSKPPKVPETGIPMPRMSPQGHCS